MLRNLAWHATDAIILAQLRMVHTLADQIGLTSDDRRRALNLTEREWQTWTKFLADGPLPAEPPLAEMLLRLAEVAFNLAMLTEAREIAA